MPPAGNGAKILRLSASESQRASSSRERITGILLWTAATSVFGAVVRIANVARRLSRRAVPAVVQPGKRKRRTVPHPEVPGRSFRGLPLEKTGRGHKAPLRLHQIPKHGFFREALGPGIERPCPFGRVRCLPWHEAPLHQGRLTRPAPQNPPAPCHPARSRNAAQDRREEPARQSGCRGRGPSRQERTGGTYRSVSCHASSSLCPGVSLSLMCLTAPVMRETAC